MSRLLALGLLCPCLALAQEQEHEHLHEDAGVVMAAIDDGGISTAEWLTIVGPRVLPEEVYRRVLSLPQGAGPDLETALLVKDQLQAFLHGTGYELSEVDVHAIDGGMQVDINEGQLERVVFMGRVTVQTVRFKLGLDIPHDVFNRPDLERQVQKLEKSLGLTGIKLVLVPTTDVAHVGPQLENVPEVKGFELIHERRPFELHIVLPDIEWDVGLNADLRITYLDGLELGGNWQGRSGIFDDDRWRIASALGVGLRRHIVTDELFVHFARAMAEARYYFPRLSQTVRPSLQVEGDVLSRLRKDINLEDYYASEITGALWLEWQPVAGIRVMFGGGWFDRRLFGLRAPPNDTAIAPGVVPEEASRPFAAVRLDFTFDPENERWDRHHLVRVELQQMFPAFGTDALAWSKLYYQYVKPFGWHDLWVRSRAYAAWYKTTFHDEASLGEFLHGAFGQDFIRRAASGEAEFRFSITRDVVKVSLNASAALYTKVDRTRDSGPLAVAFALTPGIHFLLDGMFQLDIYGAFGLRPVPGDFFAFAFSALLLKAF